MTKRKITYSLDFLPTYVLREIVELLRRGFDVEVYLPRSDARSTFWTDIISGEEGSDRLRVISLLPHQALSCGIPKLMWTALTECPGAFLKHPAGFFRSLRRAIRNRSFRSFVIGASLSRRVDEGTSLFHSHFAGSGALAAMWAADIDGKPFTLTTHAVDIFVPMQEKLVRMMFQKASTILTISRFNREYISGRFGEDLRNRIAVTHLGIDLNSLPDRIPGENEVPVVLCTASGLGQKKGVHVLLESCSILRRRSVDFKCVIVGSDTDGSKLDEYRSQASGKGLDDTIEFTGVLQSREVIQRLRRADLFVLPSVVADDGNIDGIPVSLMESMGMGIPTISTSVSGIPELIDSGSNGLLVEPDDPEALADAMERLLSDHELADRLAGQAVRKVADHFNVTGYVTSLIDVWSGFIPGQR